MTLYALGEITPSLPEGFFWIAETATALGNIHIGENVGIWFGAVLRGDEEPIIVGARTNVQDQCTLHTDKNFPLTIGEGCTIGHRATLHGCTIGDNTLVGMSATILNGAIVGKNCLIGAGALVREGQKIPDDSLVIGVPAKIVRTLDSQAVEQIRQSADYYIENARRFARDLKPL